MTYNTKINEITARFSDVAASVSEEDFVQLVEEQARLETDIENLHIQDYYAAYYGSPLYQKRDELKRQKTIAAAEEEFKNGTLYIDVPTSPDAAINGEKILVGKSFNEIYVPHPESAQDNVAVDDKYYQFITRISSKSTTKTDEKNKTVIITMPNSALAHSVRLTYTNAVVVEDHQNHRGRKALYATTGCTRVEEQQMPSGLWIKQGTPIFATLAQSERSKPHPFSSEHTPSA